MYPSAFRVSSPQAHGEGGGGQTCTKAFLGQVGMCMQNFILIGAGVWISISPLHTNIQTNKDLYAHLYIERDSLGNPGSKLSGAAGLWTPEPQIPSLIWRPNKPIEKTYFRYRNPTFLGMSVKKIGWKNHIKLGWGKTNIVTYAQWSVIQPISHNDILTLFKKLVIANRLR